MQIYVDADACPVDIGSAPTGVITENRESYR